VEISFAGELIVGAADVSFTGQETDTTPATANGTTPAMYDFLLRKYSPTQSRWLSPDPAGLAAVDMTNPQSWNRYAYALNNPMALIDPFGDETYEGCGDRTDLGCNPAYGMNIAYGGEWADPLILLGIAMKPTAILVLIDPEFIVTGKSRMVPFYGNFSLTAYINSGGASWDWWPTIIDKSDKNQNKSKNNKNICQQSFDDSKLATAVKFFSVINLVTDAKKAWPDWTVLPGLKWLSIEALKRTMIPTSEFLPITDPSAATTTIESPTVAGIDTVEGAGAAGLLPVVFATAMDAGVRSQCTYTPDSPIFAPIPKD